jgi:glyoxylase-like metal-dependent hydrolase (beta-lactamase superfamily II)
MSGHRNLALAAIALPAVMLASAPATAQFKTPVMEQKTIAPDIYMMQHPFGSSNSYFVVTPDGVLVFDADIRTADQTFAAIRKTTDKKIRYVVISHPSGDHATGAWHFREDKPLVIGSRKQMRDLYQQERAEFAERRGSTRAQFVAYKNAELIGPDLGFDGALTLQFGGLTLQIVEQGSAHSTSDVTMFVPQRRVMMMGDLLNTEIHPGPGESAQVFFSNASNWIALLDRVIGQRLPVDTYLPGHGPVHPGRGVADLEEQRRYFVVMRDAVSKMIMAGKSVEQIQKEFKTPAEFAHYRGPQRQRAFINLFYHQLLERGFWP